MIPYQNELSFAHTIFDPTNVSKKVVNQLWGDHISSCPNSQLLIKNSFYDSIISSSKIFLVHTTSSRDKIIKEGNLRSSSGCLMESIYCVQAYPETPSKLRVHNYGQHVFHHITGDDQKRLKPFVIEVNFPNGLKPCVTGINYLKMGPFYYNLINNYHHFLPISSWDSLRFRVDSITNILGKFSDKFLDHMGIIDPMDLLDEISDVCAKVDLFSYIYFEAVSQSLMLSSEDLVTTTLKRRGEMNNFLYIKIKHDIINQKVKRFSAGLFHPKYNELEGELQSLNDSGFIKVDIKSLLEVIAQQIQYMIAEYLFNKKWQLRSINTSFIGQVYYLELLKLRGEPEFSYIFRRLAALHTWNYWNSNSIFLPINIATLKGEIGINPSSPGLKCKIYTGTFNEDKSVVSIDKLTKVNITSNFI